MYKIPNVLELQQMNDAQQQEVFNNIFLVVYYLSPSDLDKDNIVNSIFYLSSKSWFVNLLKDNIFKDPNFKRGTYFDFIFLTKTHVSNKEDFLYFFSNFPNFDFFQNNVLKFQYSEHEKNIIIESSNNLFFVKTDLSKDELEYKNFFVSVFENVCVIPRFLQKDIHDSDSNCMIEHFNFLIKYFPLIEKIEHKLTVIFICFFNVYIKKETINPLFNDLYFKFCELFIHDIQYILENCLNDDSKKSKLIKDVTTPIFEKIILRSQMNEF